MVVAPKVVQEMMRVVQPPHPFVVVTQGWPSVLVTILGMGLPLGGGFLPPALSSIF